MDMVIIGGGLAGLTAAFYAKKAGHSVILLEASNRVGGVIRSERKEGYLLEYGPNTVQLKPDLLELINDLGLNSQMEIASLRTPRYIMVDGTLHPVPLSPLGLASTKLLSLQGKLRLLQEPFVPPRTTGGDETLHAFVTRRLGKEVAERLMAPFVSGVWAGDSRQLSADSFPQLTEWEKNQGSLFKGVWKARGEKKSVQQPIKGLMSFPEGLATLTRALQSGLASEIKINSPVKEIRKEKNKWRVQGDDFHFLADRLCLCAPTAAIAKMITPFAQEAAFTLNQIPTAHVALLHFGFKQTQIGAPRPGFGFLCAPSEKSNILGCLWNSNLFPDRAPAGSSLWTVFMGGLTNPKILELSDEALIERALSSLRPLMKVEAPPQFIQVTRINQAIPQYTLGHLERMRILNETEDNHPGLTFAGNFRGGISVGDVVREAQRRVKV